MTHNMMAMPDTSALFENAVLKKFAFLEQEYGFSKSIARRNQAVIVKYESKSLFVNLLFGPPAYEPEMSFGRFGLDDHQPGFNFEAGDLIQLTSCQGWSKEVEAPETIEGQVAWLAALLGECGRPCLLGDLAVYTEMKWKREALVLEWQREERDKTRGIEIEAAWKARDYKTVIQLYSAYEGVLSNIDRKRFEIAKGKV